MDIFTLYASLALKDDGFEATVNNAKKSMQSLNDSSDSMKEAIQKDSDSIQKSLLKFSAIGGAALIGVGAASMKVGEQFEYSMKDIQSTTLYTADEMKRVEDAVRSVSTNTGKSLTELASDTKMLVEAGGDIDLMTAQLQYGGNLAIATNTDWGQTYDFLSAAMKTFGYDADRTQEVTDSLAATTTMTNVSLGQMGEAYVNAGGAAALAGMSINDVNSILIMMSEAGMKGGQAGTALNAVLRNLATPTSTAAAELENLNIKLYDNNGASRDMFDIMEDLEVALAGLSDEQKNRSQSLIFDNVAMRGWNMMTADGISSVRELSGELESSSSSFNGLGQAAGMAAGMQDSLRGKMDIMKSTLQNVGLSIYQNMEAPLKKMADTGTKALTFINNNLNWILPTIKVATIAVGGFTAAWTIGNTIQKVGKAFDVAKSAVAGLTLATTQNTIVVGANAAAEQLRTVAEEKGYIVSAAGVLMTKAGTVATAQETATVLASTGAITAKNVVLGVLKGKIGLATGAQMLWNAAMTANPIGLIIAGAVALTGVIVALSSIMNKETEEEKQLHEERKQLIETNKQLIDSINDTKTAYENKTSSIEEEFIANDKLIEKLGELSSIENKSAADKEKLKLYANQLNDVLGENVVQYSEEKNALIGSNGQVIKNIDSLKKLTSARREAMKQEVLIERERELTKQLYQLELQQDKTKEALNKLTESGDNYTQVTNGNYAATARLRKELKDLEETNADINIQIQDSKEELEGLEIQIDSSAEAVANSNAILEHNKEVLEAQEGALQSLAGEYTTLAEAATNMFDRIETKSDVSFKKMKDNLIANQETVAAWGDNIAHLAELGIDEGLLETLRSAGPESAKYVAEICKQSDDQIMELSNIFAQGGDVAVGALAKSLGVSTDVAGAAANLAKDTSDSLQAQIEAADFSGIGLLVGTGLAGGIDESSAKAEESAKSMADNVAKGAKGALAISSPSKVFTDIGSDVVDGFVKGLDTGKSKVVQSVTNMMNTAKSTAVTLVVSLDFASIGQSIIDGIDNGLISNKSKITNTMKSIIQEAVEAAKKAAGIASPSKVFRDEIGKQLMLGLAEGIDDNVFEAVKKMDNAMRSLESSAQGNVDISGEGGRNNSESIVINQTINGSSGTPSELMNMSKIYMQNARWLRR